MIRPGPTTTRCTLQSFLIGSSIHEPAWQIFDTAAEAKVYAAVDLKDWLDKAKLRFK